MYVHRDIPCSPEAVDKFARLRPKRLELVNPFDLKLSLYCWFVLFISVAIILCSGLFIWPYQTIQRSLKCTRILIMWAWHEVLWAWSKFCTRASCTPIVKHPPFKRSCIRPCMCTYYMCMSVVRVHATYPPIVHTSTHMCITCVHVCACVCNRRVCIHVCYNETSVMYMCVHWTIYLKVSFFLYDYLIVCVHGRCVNVCILCYSVCVHVHACKFLWSITFSYSTRT